MVLDREVLDCRYKRSDIILAIVIAVIVLALTTFSLYPSCIWGDDFAGYINEGIAIAQGRLEEQAELNYFMHPTSMPEEADGSLVYVWGYPLMLAVIYLIFGYDTVNFSSIIYYKIPSVICFALFAAVLYLFFRRRFKTLPSIFLSLAFCSGQLFYDLINSVYNDVVYMFFCTLCLLLIEQYFAHKEIKKRLIPGIILGVVVWYTYELRLNGVTLLLVFAFCHVVTVVKEKSFSKSDILIHLIPYILFFGLRFVSEQLILMPATSNASDFDNIDLHTTAANVLYYITGLVDTIRGGISGIIYFFIPESVLPNMSQKAYDLIYTTSQIASCVFFGMAAVGIVMYGIKKNLQLSFYAVGSAIGTCLLPYNQGLRYLYGIMPVIMLFSGYGCKYAVNIISKYLIKKEAHSKYKFAVCAVITAVMSIAVISPIIRNDIENCERLEASGDDIHANMTGAYSPNAIEIYRYVQDNTAPDDIICFYKPRALYLNTGRVSYSHIDGDRSPLEADYCILTEFFYDYYTNTEKPEWFDSFEVVLRTPEMTVMRKK